MIIFNQLLCDGEFVKQTQYYNSQNFERARDLDLEQTESFVVYTRAHLYNYYIIICIECIRLAG